ncbi:MAG: excinuclease ABC subunit UvrC, partial [Planctomycetota bacterium]
MTEDLKIKLGNIPQKPGVYQFVSTRGEILYIGKAVRLRNRVRQYFQKAYEKDPRLKAMVGKIADVEVIVTDTEVEALILETNLIKERKPKYNVDLKDDKSYPYIVITNEPYPRVFATRRIIRDGSRYFGPFTDVASMHESLKLIRDTYLIRSCNYYIDQDVIDKKKIKVCLDYHIKKCEGPCEGLVGRERYGAMIREVGQVLRGKTGSLVGEIGRRMEEAASEMRFEEAAELRDRMRALDVYNQRQKVVDTELVDRDLVALATRDDDGCGVVFRIREGKITGKQHFFLSSVRGREKAGILEEFLGNYFLGTDDIPREVFIPVEIEHVDILRGYLTDRRGGAVGIVVPKIGEKAKLLQMCAKNAELFLNMLLLQKEQRREKGPPSVEVLKRDLGMRVLPRRIDCFDVSHIQGSDTVGSVVVFVDGRPRRSEYR